MSYLKQQDRIRSIRDLIDELELAGKFSKLAKGIAEGKEPLVEEELDPNDLSISKFYQRQFSVNALNSYKIFNHQLARDVVVAVRPKALGGHKLVIDGQHTAGLAIYSGAVDKIKCNVLYHPEDRSKEECIRVEGELFHAYNTQRKNPSMIDKYRAGLCFDEPQAVQFNNRLQSCNLQVDGLGDLDGDSLATSGATRFDKCIKQYDTDEVDYGAFINKAVNFIRRTWGTPAKSKTTDDKGNEIVSVFKYRDDLIHGLTTLLVLIEIGVDANGKGLSTQQENDFKTWLEQECTKKPINLYVSNTGGGNSHYKIAHRFLQEYNTFADYASITHNWAHENGVWDEEVLREKSAKVRSEILAKPESRKERLGRVDGKTKGTYRTCNFPQYNTDD